MLRRVIRNAIQDHRLPASFEEIAFNYYVPLAEGIVQENQHIQREEPLVIGVQGAQGSGKSTCSAFLKIILEQHYQLNVVVLSIDDFYLTHSQRQALAQSVHPLLQTRGVPGTHDIGLAQRVMADLKSLKSMQSLGIPCFNKAIDDRADPQVWLNVSGPIDIIILEGWCVGLCPQSNKALAVNVNELETEEDEDGIWRRYVNQQLACIYQTFFENIDHLIVFLAPSFECVYQWRLLQEQKLAEENHVSSLGEAPQHKTRIMSPKQIRRFIMHYQRLTEHGFMTLPNQAKWLVSLNPDHSINEVIEK